MSSGLSQVESILESYIQLGAVCSCRYQSQDLKLSTQVCNLKKLPAKLTIFLVPPTTASSTPDYNWCLAITIINLLYQ